MEKNEYKQNTMQYFKIKELSIKKNFSTFLTMNGSLHAHKLP